jgi:hypothetical protein
MTRNRQETPASTSTMIREYAQQLHAVPIIDISLLQHIDPFTLRSCPVDLDTLVTQASTPPPPLIDYESLLVPSPPSTLPISRPLPVLLPISIFQESTKSTLSKLKSLNTGLDLASLIKSKTFDALNFKTAKYQRARGIFLLAILIPSPYLVDTTCFPLDHLKIWRRVKCHSIGLGRFTVESNKRAAQVQKSGDGPRSKDSYAYAWTCVV